MLGHTVLVSVIIPNFNRAQLIGETLDSVKRQTFTDWEAIVVDDGSNDNSAEVVAAYAATDSRVQLYNRDREPGGAPTCRNIGLLKARGKYIIFLDSDDLLAPHCLEQRVNALEANLNLDFAVFPLQLFNVKPGDMEHVWLYHAFDDYLDGFLLRAQWQTTSPIWRRTALEKIGGFKEGVSSWQDWELHVRALSEGLVFRIFAGTPDSFCRRSDHERISKTDRQANLIIGRSKLFEEVAEMLTAKGLMNPRRVKLLGGKFLVAAGQLYELDRIGEAKNVWRNAFKLGLVSEREYKVGWLYIKMINKRWIKGSALVSKATRKVFGTALSRYIVWNY